jgi:hypothetical protein
VNIRVKIAIGAAATLVLGFLVLRFGGELAEPFLDSVGTPSDSQAVTTVQTGETTHVAAATDTSGMFMRPGPFAVNGRVYTFQVQRDTGGTKSRAAARRVQVFDSSGRVVYDENLYLRGDSTSSESWLEFYPTLIEDASGTARGFRFDYVWFPSAPSSGVAFHIVAPRGDSLAILTPTVIGFYGAEGTLPAGAGPGSSRLLPGNQLTIESSRGWFRATIPLRVDFDCVPGAMSCVRIDAKDSIAGLARFAVVPEAQEKTTTSPAIAVFAVPHGAVSDTVRIPVGEMVEITGGAARVYFERTPGLFLSADDEWIEIKVNNRRYWITGEESFRAIGLQQVG